jgi:hypothetical protein
MAAKEDEKTRQPEKQAESGAAPPVTDEDTHPALLAPSQEANPAESGQPGGGRGRVDITGIIPEGIRVDPDLTEGHPGYEESGESEIIPTERFTKGEATEEKDSG